VTGDHAVTLWHVSQLSLVAMCVAVLPRATVPLWHVAQVPTTTPAWEKNAGVQLPILWHVSQLCVVGK